MSTTPLPATEKPNPENDGIDHINVYSRGRTVLGQELSNFAHKPINHPEHGFFASLEAYWYWLGTGMIHNDLRRLYGATAKTAGIRQLPVMMPEETFQALFCDGLKLKIMQNRNLRDAVAKSTLPFRHYFVYGNNPPVIRESPKHGWQMECLEEVRKALKEKKPVLLSTGEPAEGINIREVIEPIIEDGI